MKEYSLTLFCVLAVAVVFAFLAKGLRLEKSCRTAMLLLISSVAVMPLGKIVEQDFFIPTLPGGGGVYGDGEYIDEAKRASERGIERLICDEFDLSADDVEVLCFDFDFQSMSSGEVRVILTGKAVLADYKAIERRIGSLGLGECRCVIG